jgi:hypothetical protein
LLVHLLSYEGLRSKKPVFYLLTTRLLLPVLLGLPALRGPWTRAQLEKRAPAKAVAQWLRGRRLTSRTTGEFGVQHPPSYRSVEVATLSREPKQQ